MDKGIDILLKLDYIYETADIEKKREVISSMFPEKMHFENSSLRTGRINEAVKYIYMIDSNLGGNKKGQNRNKSVLSSVVGVAGFEPTTSCSQSRRDTGLRYTPKRYHLLLKPLLVLPPKTLPSFGDCKDRNKELISKGVSHILR